MSSDELLPASAPQDLPRWERRLQVAVQWYAWVILGSVLLATGVLPIHLTGTPQWLASVVLTAEFVLFLPAGFILIVQAMRRNPATSRLQAWGFRLLVAGVFGGSVLFAYGRVIGLLPEWRSSNTEILALAVLGVLMFGLVSLGLALVFVALIGELWRLARSRYRRPPA